MSRGRSLRIPFGAATVTVFLIIANGCSLPGGTPQAVRTQTAIPSAPAARGHLDPSVFPPDPFNQVRTAATLEPNVAVDRPPAGSTNPSPWDRPVVTARPVSMAQGDDFQQVESAFASARQAVDQQSAGCVDRYYYAAEQAYAHLASAAANASDRNLARAWQIYNASIVGMLINGQRYGRFDPQRGLVVNTPRGPGAISVAFRGFVWQASDFNRLLPADADQRRNLLVNVRSDGLGIPLVVIRQRQRPDGFLDSETPFAATAVLRPTLSSATPIANGAGTIPEIATLELLDPLRVETSEFSGRQMPVTRDFSAPLDYARKAAPPENWTAYFRSDEDTDDGLYMLEPYQPGKIPLVLVHGLASDWTTWVDLVNQLRVDPLVLNRYQIWTFQYGTRKPFLGAAMNLRQQLHTIVDRYDPERQDPALQQMVLVGHSMGGLVSKLQVTYGGDVLWNEIANRPFAQLQGDPTTLKDLHETFFFQPVPMVKRVVFVATPHRGSSLAARTIGRLASGLVIDSSILRNEHRQLLQRNPGVFAPFFQRRIPTSVDLLEPNSPLLSGMNRLTFAHDIQLHSIIGTRGARVWEEASDGVVAVSSARHPRVISEKLVDARHDDLHRDRESTAEILRILREHQSQADASTMARVGQAPRSPR